MTLKLITRLTPLVVGKFIYSQIHDWSGNGGGKLPYQYRTKKYKNRQKNSKNFGNLGKMKNLKFEKRIYERNK
tara:strand:+ start:213 stop:431 length:219 start_codon:yes stop_codon:yes gene_type:complete